MTEIKINTTGKQNQHRRQQSGQTGLQNKLNNNRGTSAMWQLHKIEIKDILEKQQQIESYEYHKPNTE